MDINNILSELERNVRSSSNFTSSTNGQELFTELIQTWINERCSPELLNYKEELITTILNDLKNSIEIIEINSIELEKNDEDIKLKLLIIENELERVNFVIRSYLRCRLYKIDKYSQFINDDINEYSKLNKSEVTYMNEHLKILEKLYNKNFLSELPEHLQNLKDNSGGISMITKPNLNKFVFVKVTKDNAEPIRFNDHEIVLEKDDIHTIQYKYIKRHIDDGEVILI